jgi:hypothetical protein
MPLSWPGPKSTILVPWSTRLPRAVPFVPSLQAQNSEFHGTGTVACAKRNEDISDFSEKPEKHRNHPSSLPSLDALQDLIQQATLRTDAKKHLFCFLFLEPFFSPAHK